MDHVETIRLSTILIILLKTAVFCVGCASTPPPNGRPPAAVDRFVDATLAPAELVKVAEGPAKGVRVHSLEGKNIVVSKDGTLVRLVGPSLETRWFGPSYSAAIHHDGSLTVADRDGKAHERLEAIDYVAVAWHVGTDKVGTAEGVALNCLAGCLFSLVGALF